MDTAELVTAYRDSSPSGRAFIRWAFDKVDAETSRPTRKKRPSAKAARPKRRAKPLPKRAALTEAERDEIVNLATQKGWTSKRIAIRFKVHPVTVTKVLRTAAKGRSHNGEVEREVTMPVEVSG